MLITNTPASRFETYSRDHLDQVGIENRGNDSKFIADIENDPVVAAGATPHED
jgi:hypothetical protein